MKIAVISSYAYIVSYVNYGALLQYYALQEYLKKRGHDPYWIRYEIPKTPKQKLKQIAKYILRYHTERRKKNLLSSFQKFAQKYLSLSDQIYYGETSLHVTPPTADCYITGSDQVWAGKLQANFLTFVPQGKPRIAYAVSFGKDSLPPEHTETIRPWVHVFDAISVREQTGVAICETLGWQNVPHVPDPTLLINKEEYPCARIKQHNYIFCYFINLEIGNSIDFNAITTFARHTNKSLYISAASGSERFIPKQNLIDPTPEEWLAYYRDSDYILANTFHGIVFAIIFERPFLCILQNGASARQNCRMLSLLTSLGLQDRILINSNELEQQIKQPINWEVVRSHIKELRERTDMFFNSCNL